jgi:hypothetical protein
VYIETRRKIQCTQSGVNAIKRTGDYIGTRNIFYQIIKINETQTLQYPGRKYIIKNWGGRGAYEKKLFWMK